MADDKKKPTSAKASSTGAKPRPSTQSAPRGSNVAGRQRAESIGFLAIAAGILIALNVIGVFLFSNLFEGNAALSFLALGFAPLWDLVRPAGCAAATLLLPL